MKTYGHGAPAVLLLLLLSLVATSNTLDVRIVERSKRALISKRDTNKIILEEIFLGKNKTDAQILGCGDNQNAAKINDHVLALLTRKNKSKRSSKPGTKFDQDANPSQTIIINMDDIKDLENLEHALSMVEYEPQKVSAKKTKRKTIGQWNDSSDSSEASNESRTEIASDVGRAYYDVPRQTKPRNRKPIKDTSAETSSRSSKSTQRNLESVADIAASDPSFIKRRLKPVSNKNVDLEYATPSPIRKVRPRNYNNRFQVNPEVSRPQLITSDETNLQDIQTLKQFAPSYSASLNSLKRSKYPGVNVDTVTLAQPSTESFNTKTIRKRNRKVAPTKLKTPEDVQTDENNNYNSNAASKVPRNVGNRDSENSKRFGLLAKYDIAPRPFAIAKNQGGNSNEEKSLKNSNPRNKYVNGNGNRSSREQEEVNSKENNGRGRSIYRGRNPEGFHRSPPQQVNMQGDFSSSIDKHRQAEYKKSEESDKLSDVIKVGIVPSFNAHKESGEIDSTRNANLNGNPLKQHLYSNSYGTTASFVPTQVTSLDSESYENIKTPSHASQSSQSNAVATVVPYAASNHYSGSLVGPATMKPLSLQGDLEESGGRRIVEKNDSSGSQESESSEEVALASSQEAKEQSRDSDESAAGYEIHETPNERYNDGHPEGSAHHQVSGIVAGDSKAAGTGHSSGGHSSGGDGGGSRGDNMKFEKGGGMERGEHHKQSKGEKGEKGYKSWHEDDKASKGHHDKERHTKYYDENDGKEKESREEGGYHEEYKKGEKGDKGAEFGETGKHEKGHSTKGQHFIHKKDEFEKKTEFFDEYHEEGDVEKDGEFKEEHEFSKGGHEKSSHHEEKDHEEKYGKEGKHEKGGHYREDKGRKISEGEDSHYDHEESYGKKGGHEEGKKWGYKHASPTDGKPEH